MEPEPTATSRKRPRLGVALRLLIYVPLVGIFGWQAIAKITNQRRAVDERMRTSIERWVEHPPRTIMMPNGEAMPVLELSESEAIEMGLLEQPSAEPQDAASPASE